MTPAAELGELTAFVDLYEAAPEDVGAKVEGIGGAAYLAPPAVPRSAMFNRAPRARAARDRGRPHEIAGFFRGFGSSGAPRWPPGGTGRGWLLARGARARVRRRASGTA